MTWAFLSGIFVGVTIGIGLMCMFFISQRDDDRPDSH